jgi:large-conductance mechanosensitive channel
VTPGLALADAKKLGPVFAYGNFITITINFAIVAFCIFLLIKGINRMKTTQKRSAGSERLSGVRDVDSGKGDPLPALHY